MDENNFPNPNDIKDIFLDYLNQAKKENKEKEFCSEILKLYSNKLFNKISVDTICYLAAMNAGIKNLKL
jgi:hypothetical protein